MEAHAAAKDEPTIYDEPNDDGLPCGCYREFGDRCYNIGRDHWAVCETHKYRWSPGGNLMSGWRDETEEDWKRNAEILAGYSLPPREWFDGE
jgi:hypothetical protein